MYSPVAIMSPDFTLKGKGKQRSNETFVSPTTMYSLNLCISWEKVCGQCHEQTLACEVVFFATILQSHCQYSKNVTRVNIKYFKAPSIIRMVKFNLLRLSRHFECGRNFCVIASLLKDRVHGFHDICNKTVKTFFQMKKIWRVWRTCLGKHKFLPCIILVRWQVGNFRNCNLPLTFQIQLLWQKRICKGADFFVCKCFRRCNGNQLYCKRSLC